MRFAVNTGKIFSIKIGTILLSLVLSVFTTRVLKAEGRGILAVTAVLVSIVEIIFRNGSEVSVLNFLHKKDNSREDWVNNSLTLAICSGLLGTFCMLFFFKAIAHIVFPETEINFNLILVSAPQVLFSMLLIYQKNILLAEHRYNDYGLLEFLLPILSLAATFALLVSNQVNVMSMIVINTVVVCSTVLLGFALLAKSFRLAPAFNFKVWKQLLHYGMRGHVGNLLDFANARLDVVLISALCGVRSAGVYSLAGMAERLHVIPNAIGQTLLAEMSKRREEVSKRSGQVCRNTLFITGFAVIAAMIVGLYIPQLYGSEFKEAVWPFELMCIGVLLICVSKTLKSYIYIYMERPQISTFASVINFVVNIGLLLVLVKPYGIIGAAIATIVGYFFYTMIHVIAYRRHSKTSLAKTLIVQKEDIEVYISLWHKIRLRFA